MKKYFSAVTLLPVLMIVALVSACGSDDKESTVMPDEEIKDTQPVITVEWEPDGILTEGEYSGVHDSSRVKIRWFTDREYIFIGIEAATDGWVAVGFEPVSRMNNADIIMGMVEDGQVIVSDQFSTGNFGPHKPDTELGGTDDVIEYGGKENSGVTTIEFKRLLVTGDTYDNDVTGDTVKLIWAYGSADDLEKKHIVRSTIEISKTSQE